MKKLLVTLCAMFLFFGALGVANAALLDRGGGLIYDDVLNITWLQDASYAQTQGVATDSYYAAMTWANNLTYYDSVRDVTWDDWRLPKNTPINGSTWSISNVKRDGTADFGSNISESGTLYAGSTASEMAYMFYNSLNNDGKFQINGDVRTDGTYGLINIGPFINLRTDDDDIYWSSTKHPSDDNSAFWFNFDNGVQYTSGTSYSYNRAWAVRDGDVAAAPIPGAVWLLGSGLIGIVGIRRRYRN